VIFETLEITAIPENFQAKAADFWENTEKFQKISVLQNFWYHLNQQNLSS